MPDPTININARLLVDVPPATSYILHSSELRQVYINKLRTDFLNYNGQDYFILNPRKEQIWNDAWKDQAKRKYNQTGDYLIDITTEEETFIDLNSTGTELVCSEYIWVITIEEVENLDTIVQIEFINCKGNSDSWTGPAGAIVENKYNICAIGVPVVSVGKITYSQPCPE
jgi:hypothetical protein